MFNLDKIQQKKTKILAAMSKAIKEQDDEAIKQSMNDWTDYVADSVISQAEQSAHIVDSAILAARGIRQLTSQEREYYNKLCEASKANDPKMAVNGITEAFPLTTFDTVLDDVKKTHRLLELIDMKSSSAAIKFVKNKTGKQTGVWGELTSAIAGEVNAEVEVVDATLFKLTAFMYVSKDLFDYGPEWVDKFVRDVLAEVIAVSSETAVVDGDGNKKPIGMTRNISDEASVVGGVYPKANDNNAFQRLDISALEPANFTVKIVNTEEDPANMRMIAAGSTSEAATAGE